MTLKTLALALIGGFAIGLLPIPMLAKIIADLLFVLVFIPKIVKLFS
jgi:hypothetical protein